MAFLLAVFTFSVVLLGRSLAEKLPGSKSGTSFRAHNSAGNDAYGRHGFAAAIREYGAMIRERPDKVDGYLLRGMAEYRAGRFAAAVQDDTVGLALMDAPSPYFYVHGQPGAGSRHPSAAGDSTAALLFNRALAQEGMGRHAQAIAGFSASLARQPGDYDAYAARMSAFYENKQYAPAIADASHVIAHDPHDQYAFGIRGKAEASTGDRVAARQDLEHALLLDPHYLPAYVMLAQMADTAHQGADAVEICQKAVDANPGSAPLMGSLGWFQYKAGQTADAIITDKEALALDSAQPWVRGNLALCYAVSGDALQAPAAYAQALDAGSETDRAAFRKDI